MQVNLLERDQTKVLGWCGGKEAIIKIDAGDEWTEYTAEAPLKPEARVLTLFLRIKYPTEGKAIWIDDVSIERAEPAAAP